MKRIILILVAVIVVFGIGAWFVFFRQSADISGVTITAPLQNASGSLASVYHIPTSTTVTIGTPSGAVTVKNFYATALGAEDQFVVLTRHDAFEITYDTATSQFFIGVKQGPLAATRPAAEAAFLNALGVSQIDACKLAVAVGIEPSVDPAFAHQGLSLSFCRGATGR
jgi:hypothetical protein